MQQHAVAAPEGEPPFLGLASLYFDDQEAFAAAAAGPLPADVVAACDVRYAAADGAGECRVLGVRAQGNVILLRLADVTDMDAARAQVGRTYYFAKADARLPKGRYFIDDLLGCEVKDADNGTVYGTLTEVDHPAAQDIYTVTDAAGEKHMLPAVPEFVKTIDIGARTILVTPIDGMFNDAVNGDKE